MYQNNYFQHLPPEIQLKIFSYLQPVDLVNLGDNYTSLQYIISMTKLRNVTLKGDYRFSIEHLSNFISKKPVSQCITTLNITHVYWIPRYILKQSLVQLTSLTTLYAADTKLDFITILHHLMEDLKHLINVSASFPTSYTFTKVDVNNLCRLSCLYIFYYRVENICKFLNACLPVILKNLQVFWIMNINKPFTYCSCHTPPSPLRYNEMFTLDMLRGNHLKELFVNEVRLKFSDDLKNMPCCNCRCQLNSIQINEDQLLTKGHVLKTCCCTWKEFAEKHEYCNGSISNSIRLEEIEITECSRHCDRRNSLVKNAIDLKSWVSLKKITLRYLPYTNGSHFIELFKACVLLESIDFTCKSPPDTFTNHLCGALEFANNLKDFRYVMTVQIISIVSLLQSLASRPKLQRVHIECVNKPTNPMLLLQAIDSVWSKPTMIFVGILMDETQVNVHKIRKAILKDPRNSNKIFLFDKRTKRDESHFYIMKTVPAVHFREMFDSISDIPTNVDFILPKSLYEHIF